MALNLPTMAVWNATHGATPKHQLATKLDRDVLKKAAKRQDEQKLRAWALAVKVRDGYKDRMTGRTVKGTRAADPDRAESHHVEPRENRDTRYDIRNGLCVSYATHDAIERNKIKLLPTRWFYIAGRKYADCTFKVRFVETP